MFWGANKGRFGALGYLLDSSKSAQCSQQGVDTGFGYAIIINEKVFKFAAGVGVHIWP